MSYGEQSAFPVLDRTETEGYKTAVYSTSGLTKREYFSSQCLAALLSTLTIERDAHAGFLAETAVMHADALIRALDREDQERESK